MHVVYSSTFCSISLSSEPSDSVDGISAIQEQVRQQKLQQMRLREKRRFQQRSRQCTTTSCWCCGLLRLVQRVRFVVLLACLLGFTGLVGIIVAIAAQFTVDQYIFLGAMVSCAFSLVVILCYLKSRSVRSHPNPLIFSKRCMSHCLAPLSD